MVAMAVFENCRVSEGHGNVGPGILGYGMKAYPTLVPELTTEGALLLVL